MEHIFIKFLYFLYAWCTMSNGHEVQYKLSYQLDVYKFLMNLISYTYKWIFAFTLPIKKIIYTLKLTPPPLADFDLFKKNINYFYKSSMI